MNHIPSVRAFIDQFFKLYVDKNNTWNESHAIFSPSTNNGLERLNLTIKNRYLGWSKVNIIDSVKKTVFEIITDAVEVREPNLNKINFYQLSLITDKDFSDGEFLKLDKHEDKEVILLGCCSTNGESYISVWKKCSILFSILTTSTFFIVRTFSYLLMINHL